MGLNFSQVVSVNNILAMQDFSTFLFNYKLHEKPNYFERWVITSAEKWIELRARKEFIELKASLGEVNLKLKDCPTSLFTVLYLAKQGPTYANGQDLFKAIADTELDFERIKNPRAEASYQSTEI